MTPSRPRRKKRSDPPLPENQNRGRLHPLIPYSTQSAKNNRERLALWGNVVYTPSMKIRPNTIEVDDETRRAIRRFVGRTGLATRAEIRAEIDGLIADNLDSILDAGDDGDE